MCSQSNKSDYRANAVFAAAATLAAALWLLLVLTLARGGAVTGIYYTGLHSPAPPELAENIHRVPDRGYDAQFYHFIAHDPLLTRGFARYVDNPRLRWRRILVPGLAAVFSLGDDEWVDSAYLAVVLASVFAGAFWLSQLAARFGRHPAWGCTFLLVPSVLVSLDRGTVDIALAALALGLLVYRRPWPILIAAALARETGILFALAYAAHAALDRRGRDAMAALLCLAPAAAWYAYVHGQTPADLTPWLAGYPYSGLIERTINGVLIPPTTLWLKLAGVTERLALTGLWFALFATAWLLWRRRFALPELTAAAFAIFGAALGKLDIWADTYAAGRVMSPLLLMLAVVALRDRRWIYAAPLACALPRIALQYQSSLKAILRALIQG